MKNKTALFFVCINFTLLTTSCAQKIDSALLYLAQNPPSELPQRFAPGLISLVDESEFGSVFSKNGKEFFYAVDLNGRAEIRYTNLKNGAWSTPLTILSHTIYSHNDPFLSPDEDKLYYISNRPVDGLGDKKDYDIWYSKRTETGWSAPINIDEPVNTDKNEYYVSFTSEGTLFFASNYAAESDRSHDFDLYSAKFLDGHFQRPERLSNYLNSKKYEADVFISPDESYIIFCAVRKEGLGKGDLYISFKKKDDSWSTAKNMGAPINTEKHELCPFVSNDGKYFFYTSNQDIYWVDAKIINMYR